MQPVTDIYLKSEGISDGLNHGDIRLIWIFGAIAVFIVLLACINFINLSTAKSSIRAKEVGMRKTIGSSRGNLINQFLTESLLYSFLSFVLGLLIAMLFLPFFNMLANKSLVIPFSSWQFWLIWLVSCVMVGLLAGIYPSVYLASFKAISAITGKSGVRTKNAGIRHGLVIFQFTISIILIIGTLIINNQMGYILNKKLGFNKEQVLVLHGTNVMGNQVVTFKDQLLKLGTVKYVSISDFLPVEGTKRNNNGWWKEGKINQELAVSGQAWVVDNDYVPTMGMHITQGRNFSDSLASDRQGILINETMNKQLGLDEPIGQRITNNMGTWNIIGVVEDFHFESLKNEIRPLALIPGISPTVISLRAGTGDMPTLIKSVTAVWNKFSPNQEIRYSFLDQDYAKMYKDVQRTGQVFLSIAILAIIIACLGIFGLVTFTSIQRNKEIGIRKVNGARIIEIMLLLNKELITWVIVSFILACPIAWYAMNKWLENFTYKTALSWWVFALAVMLALGIALLTVSFQSWRAATRNPVEALRYE